jgi:MFS family permease
MSPHRATAGDSPSLRRIVSAALIGSAIEWYDFFIYGATAALVFPKLFFPAVSETAGLLAAFATFGAGFLARPIGGAVLGHLGDRIGRKATLVLSILGMGIGTTAVGVLPTYHQIGIGAPLALLFLRLVQGFSVGGELGGAVLIAFEHSPENRRGLYGSFAQLGVPAGLVMSNIVLLVMGAATTSEQFDSWAWRIPFLLSTILIVVGLLIRRNVAESPTFKNLRSSRAIEHAPIRTLLRTSRRQLVFATGSFIAPNAISNVVAIYALTYGAGELSIARGTLLAMVISGSVAWIVSIPIAASLSDRFGRRPVILSSLAVCAIASAAFFPLLETRSAPVMTLAFLLTMAALGAANAPQAAMFSEQFAPAVRYSGISIVLQVGSVAGGGIAPFVAAALFESVGGSWPISLYMLGVCFLSLLCTAALLRRGPNTAGDAIRAESGGVGVAPVRSVPPDPPHK